MPRQHNAKWEHLAKVTVPGGVSFPLDMLRYDSCSPVREKDSHLIEQSFGHRHKYEQGAQPMVIFVKRYTESKKDARWTVANWESWHVTIEEVDCLPPTFVSPTATSTI